MTIERYLSVKIRKWRTKYFKSKTAVIVSISVGLAIIIMNMTFVSLIDYDTATTNITCLTEKHMTYQMKFNFFFIF